VGVVADLPPDSSPLQIRSEGIYEGKPFVVAGRIIYEYELGGWSEWHIVFNDGRSGWLSDAQLDYAVSFLTPPGPIPASGELITGHRFFWNNNAYQVVAVTEARYRGVEGELPFEYWDKSEATFADLLSEDGRFATIDYSDATPLLFLGKTVEFEELGLKNLGEFEGWQ
jgi:hypothetical protein